MLSDMSLTKAAGTKFQFGKVTLMMDNENELAMCTTISADAVTCFAR